MRDISEDDDVDDDGDDVDDDVDDDDDDVDDDDDDVDDDGDCEGETSLMMTTIAISGIPSEGKSPWGGIWNPLNGNLKPTDRENLEPIE